MSSCAINEVAELWSAPWHELQRSLAAGDVASSGRHHGISAGATVRTGTLTIDALPAGSWLLRARNRMLPSP